MSKYLKFMIMVTGIALATAIILTNPSGNGKRYGEFFTKVTK